MALERLTGTFDQVRRAGVAGVLALAMAFTPAANAEPTANTNAPAATAQSVSAQQIVVPTRDARGVGAASVKSGAARVSNDAQVIVYFGDNAQAYDSIMAGAREALAQGLPLKGVIIASPLTPEVVNGVQIAGSNQILYYADGQLTGTTDNADKPGESTLAQLAHRNLNEDFQNIIAPRRTLAMNTATSSP